MIKMCFSEQDDYFRVAEKWATIVSLKRNLNVFMWHIYKMCTETGMMLGCCEHCTVQYSGKSPGCKCQLAGFTDTVHNTVINIQMST